MPNEENTQQLSNANGEKQSLEARVTILEEIILARLNDTRPFEHQMLARVSEMLERMAAMQEELATVREEQVAMREEQAAMRADFNQFRQEINENFRLLIEKIEVLSSDVIDVRAKHRLLEKHVARLEEQAA